MLGGLIAGAIGGGATAVNSLADQAIAEARQAKNAAYEKGILEWRIQETRVDADTQFGRQKELNDQQNSAAMERDQKNNEAQDKRTAMQVAASARRSTGDQAQEQLLVMKNQYLNETDPEARKKLAEDIAFFEGRTPAKPEYMSVKNELGAETAYIKTPNGLIPAPILGVSPAQGASQEEQGPWNSFKGQPAAPTQPAKSAPPPIRPGLISGNSGGTNLSSDPQNVKRLYNEGIKNAMRDVQQRIAAAPTDQEKIQLAAQYSELQAKLRK